MRHRLLFSALSAIGASVALTTAVPAAAENLRVHLKGFEEVPSVSTAASGELRLKINDKAGKIEYDLEYENLQGTITQAHIHFAQKGVNGSIVIWLCKTANTFPADPAVAALTPMCPGTSSGQVKGIITAANVIAASTTSQLVLAGELDAVIEAIRAGVAYGNVHTSVSPGGEIRGQLH